MRTAQERAVQMYSTPYFSIPIGSVIEEIQWDAQPQWQDIATAPKDGKEVLLCGTGRMGVGFYNDSPSLGNYGPWLWGFTHQPTHWMPLPKPPTD